MCNCAVCSSVRAFVRPFCVHDEKSTIEIRGSVPTTRAQARSRKSDDMFFYAFGAIDYLPFSFSRDAAGYCRRAIYILAVRVGGRVNGAVAEPR